MTEAGNRGGLIRSIDRFIVEVYDQDGVDYVNIDKTTQQGWLPRVTFMKGDEEKAGEFLANLANVLGVKITREK